jgi:hypothetical protein
MNKCGEMNYDVQIFLHFFGLSLRLYYIYPIMFGDSMETIDKIYASMYVFGSITFFGISEILDKLKER